MFQGLDRTILLVEDQAIIAMSEKAVLEKRGFHVRVAHNGETAVEIGTKDQEIDLVLMDIDLGRGIDGTKAANRILQVRDIPIVFLTSHSEQEMVEKVKGITRYGYVLKNAGEFVLLESVEMAFDLFAANQDVAVKEERFQYLFDFNRSCIAVLNAINDGADFVFVDYNHAAERADGVDREHVIGRPVTEVFPGVADSGILAAFQSVWASGEPREVSDALYRDDRIEVWRDNNIYKLPGGEIVSVYHDVTREKTLQASLERAYATINSSDVIAITWKDEPGWPVQHVSENVMRILGHQPEDLTAGTIAYESMIEPADLERVKSELQRSAGDESGSTVVHAPYRIITKAGNTRWFDDRTVIRRDEKGEIVAFDGVLIDITERREVMEDSALAKQEIECLYEISRLVERDGITLPGILQGTVELIDRNIGDKHAMGFCLTVDGREYGADDTAPSNWTREYPIFVEGGRRGELSATGHVEGSRQRMAERLETAERVLEAVTERLGRIIERYEREEQFRRLFEKSAQGIVYHTYDGTVIMANEAAEQILGLSYGQLRGLTSLDPRWRAIHEDGSDYSGETHPAMEALRTGEYVERQIMGVFHPQKGEYVWLSVSAFPEFRPGETAPYRVFATFEDITSTKKREIEQREHRLIVDGVFNAIEDSVAVIDSDLTVSRANTGTEKLFEPDGEVVGRKCHEVFYRRSEPCTDCPARKAFVTKRPEEMERTVTFEDGRTKTFEVVAYPIVDESGAVDHVVEWCRDTTELIRTEKESRSYAQRLDQTMHAAEIAWWEIDLRDGSVTFSSRKASLLGYAADRFRHYRDFTDLLHPDDHEQTMDAMRDHVEGRQERYDVEYRVRTASGEYRWFHDVGSVIERDVVGEPTVVSGVVLDVSEHRRVQGELRENEAKYRRLVDNSPSLICEVDADTFEIIHCNPAMAETLGHEVDEVVGQSIKDFVSPEVMENRIKEGERALQDNAVRRFEAEWNGRHFLHHLVPHFSGRRRYVQTITYDITELKQSQEALRESTVDLNERVKQLSCLYQISALGADRFLTIDDLFLEILRIMPQSCWRSDRTVVRIEFDGREYTSENYGPAASTLRADIVDHDVTRGFIEVGGTGDLDGKDTAFLPEEGRHLRSIAELVGLIASRNQGIDILRRSEQRFRDIVEHTSDWIWEVDRDGRFTYSSPKIEDLLGYAPDEVLGKTPFDLMLPEEAERVGRLFEEIVGEGRAFTGLENTAITKNGERVTVETAGVPVTNDEDELIGFRGMDRDVTERKQREIELRDLVRERDTLLKEMNHRVKNNLAMVSSLINMKDRDIGDSVDLSDLRNRVSVVQTMHEYLYKTDDATHVNLIEYLRKIADGIVGIATGVATGVAATEVTGNTIRTPAGTAQSLGLVVNELVTNAVKYQAEPGQPLTVAVHADCDSSENTCVLTVSDSGPPFPEEIGLENAETMGLRLVSGLVEQIGGTIELTKTPHPSFSIRFPVDRSDSTTT